MESQKTLITVETLVNKPVSTTWSCWTNPEDIVHWNAASDDWHCPEAETDLRKGGKFRMKMAARDGSMAFDFEGHYTHVVPDSLLEYVLADDRTVQIQFKEEGGKTRVTETFEAENIHSPELQKTGWQSILDRFKAYAESK